MRHQGECCLRRQRRSRCDCSRERNSRDRRKPRVHRCSCVSLSVCVARCTRYECEIVKPARLEAKDRHDLFARNRASNAILEPHNFNATKHRQAIERRPIVLLSCILRRGRWRVRRRLRRCGFTRRIWRCFARSSGVRIRRARLSGRDGIQYATICRACLSALRGHRARSAIDPNRFRRAINNQLLEPVAIGIELQGQAFARKRSRIGRNTNFFRATDFTENPVKLRLFRNHDDRWHIAIDVHRAPRLRTEQTHFDVFFKRARLERATRHICNALARRQDKHATVFHIDHRARLGHRELAAL